MLTLERYEIDQTPEQISIEVNQKKNALINIGLSLVIIVLAMWLLFSSDDSSFFLYVLLAIGVLWLMAAMAGYRKEERYVLTDDGIEYHSSGRSGPNKLSASDLSGVLLQKIVRPTGGKKRKIPFPWRVTLIDNNDVEFKGAFKFQKDEKARKLASIIAEFYRVDIQKEER